MAVDTQYTFPSLASLNQTLGGTIPQNIVDQLSYNHTRLRFNDTLIHTPPLAVTAISNTLLK